MDATPLPHLVVFCDPSDAPPGLSWFGRLADWAQRALLRPGFRHCFVLVPMWAPAFQGWVQVDPLFIGMNINLSAPNTLECIEAQADAGQLHFAWAHPVRKLRVLGFAPLTCVSVVKAVLGCKCRALTPYGLYRHLKREEIIMGGFFGSGKKEAPAPDNSAMEEQLRVQREDRERLERENLARRRNARGNTGAAQLRFSGA
ncbi:MAG: hypothetical protein H7Y60_09220, partial [Rhodospirillaceae bacterium]|nr:hypothetical protein [Rhodospirillales bacterium]